MSSASFSALLT